MRLLTADPRHGQIATYGLVFLGFDLALAQVVVTIASALTFQAAADRLTGRDVTSGAKSALISALSRPVCVRCRP